MNEERINRLRWQCRRGMLELDLLLLCFLDKNWVDLNDADQALFEELLTYSDAQLYRHFIKEQPNKDPSMQVLIEKVKRGY